MFFFFCFNYRVITLVANVEGSGGGFSRIIIGGGVFGGVGRSSKKEDKLLRDK